MRPGMIGISGQDLTKPLGGPFKLPFEQERCSKAMQCAHVARRICKSACKSRHGVLRIGATNVDAAKLDGKFCEMGRSLQTSLERSFSLCIATERDKEHSKLVKGSCKGRAACCGALQPLEGFGFQPHLAQRECIMCFGDGVLAQACGLFERHKCVAWPL